jgi:hypothetical protein
MDSEFVITEVDDHETFLCDGGCDKPASRVAWHRTVDGEVDDKKAPPIYLCDGCAKALDLTA